MVYMYALTRHKGDTAISSLLLQIVVVMECKVGWFVRRLLRVDKLDPSMQSVLMDSYSVVFGCMQACHIDYPENTAK